MISLIIYLIVPYYLDKHSNYRYNTFTNTQPHVHIVFDVKKPTLLGVHLVIHDNSVNCMAP